MSDRKLKFWLNQVMNHVAQEAPETERQVDLLRELAEQLKVEAAAMEIVSAGKDRAA